MRTQLVFAAFALLCACATPVVTTASFDAAVQSTTADRADIERQVFAFEDAWNRHDMTAFANLFHDDAEWVHWRGGLWTGRQEIYEGHRAIHETYYSTSHATVRHIEGFAFLAPTVAYLRVRSDMTGDQRYPGETFRYRRTMIFTKVEGQWLIARGHNTRMVENQADVEIHDDLD
jgi:uncharacterized protein (TIGR02246 family)